VLPQGINGCGFESHLEGANLALRRTSSAEEDEFGFIRPDAHLMIVIISDEVDCSYNKDWETIFSSEFDGGNQVFWSRPEDPMPTSAVCWNAGVQCSGAGSPYDECHAEDYDVDGNPTSDVDDAVLHPLSRYQAALDDLRASKAGSHGQVFVFGILGVDPTYPSTRTIAYAQSPDPTFQDDFGIGEGCSSATSSGLPPVRMLELIEGNALTAASPLHSICGANYGPALDAMISQVGAFVGP
jgi:hypothetical protein